MKITIKEAFATAQKALPNHKISVEVKMSNRYSYKDEEVPKITWEIWAEPKEGGENAYDSDEIFIIALSKVMAELNRATSKPIEDVAVEQEAEEVEKKEDAETTNY